MRRHLSQSLGCVADRVRRRRPADVLAGLRPKPYLAVSVLAFLWLSVGNFSLPLGAFTTCAGNGSNSFATNADWTAPDVDSTAVAKQTGYSAGYIPQGGWYYVYANITDSGNPASGISTVTADTSTFDGGQTSVSLTSGSYSAEGVSYGYRSGLLLADGAISEGSKSYTITTTDNDSNSDTKTGFSVTIDNTAPSASDAQTANDSGGTACMPELGDTVTYTFDEPMDPESIYSGWNGSSTNVVVRLNNSTSNDRVRIYDSANSAELDGIKYLKTGGNYVSADRTFGASGTPSTMVMSGATVTVTLGTASGAVLTDTATDTIVWQVGTGNHAYDRAGNDTTSNNGGESGAADCEF